MQSGLLVCMYVCTMLWAWLVLVWRLYSVGLCVCVWGYVCVPIQLHPALLLLRFHYSRWTLHIRGSNYDRAVNAFDVLNACWEFFMFMVSKCVQGGGNLTHWGGVSTPFVLAFTHWLFIVIPQYASIALSHIRSCPCACVSFPVHVRCAHQLQLLKM